MGILKFKYTSIGDGFNYSLPNSKFEQFNASILNLGDISAEGEYSEALAAIFDLEAFTSFCNQIDPHLVIPEYLSKFLDWLFHSVSNEMFQRKQERRTILWCQLPFYAKFLGDGVLFLWDTRNVHPLAIGNIVVSLKNICEDYRDTFLPEIRKSVSKAPAKLRCGIARGQIVSVGEGHDFVGPCINNAARLQKLGQFSFTFSKRGFDLEKHFIDDAREFFTLIKTPIRGIGDEELLFVLKKEFTVLPSKEQRTLSP